MTTPHDITDDIPLDISAFTAPTTFTLTDMAYDLTIDDIPFVASVSNQNPYRRETAQYRKDQFDNSQEPGEQSLTGWWLRSQTSWHNGAGISFYEPGTDYQHVSHRFFDSRGIDVWTIGEAKLLNDVFHSYTGANGIIAVAGESVGGTDYIVSGDSAGILKKLTLNGDATTSPANYTLATGHNAAGQPINPFKAITSDGTRYFAVCDVAIHAGNIDGTDPDVVVARHATGGLHSIKYVKGYLMFGEAEKLYYIPVANPLVNEGHGGSAEKFPTGTVFKRHINPNFVWNAIEGGDRFIYAGGYAGSDSEIWAIPFDETTLAPDPTSAIQVIQLPYGETINAMQYYLGYMAVGTSKGVRIAQSNSDGSLTLGPLLVETEFPVTGFTATGNYVFASTSVAGENGFDNAILIRIDLSQQFSDGTFAYAYDLQYESDEDSYASDVLFAEDRLHIIVNEGGDAGEIQTEKLSQKRASGWLQTGKIRYGTVEPKFFRYINVQCDTGQGDSIVAYTINDQGNQASIATLSAGLSNQDVFIGTLSAAQELVSFKFVFNNVTEDAGVPVLNAYQIKAVPAAKRQRLIQYPLSCFDHEMDKFNSIFGYEGRAISTIQRLEGIEQTGRFVNITDYRTGEQYQGIIEEVRFTNESSPDKNSSGFGGLLLVTVRKL
jgi:hypothetical protein